MSPTPIEVPNDSPRFAMANIGGAPLITAGAFLAGFAGYLLTNGEGMPHDAKGWLGLLGSAAVAGLGALWRGPQKTTTVPLLPLFLLLALTPSACKNATTPTGPSAAVINTLVVGATGLACSAIPAVDRPAVSVGLQTFLSLLNTDPAAALAQASDPANPINVNAGIGWIWAALHSVLDPLGPAGWSTFGASLMRGAVVACLGAIGG